MIDYQEFVALAIELIGESGREIEFRQLTATPANPDKPWAGPGQPTVGNTLSCIATFLPTSGQGMGLDFIAEDLMKKAEQVALIAPQGGTLEPYNTIFDDGKLWKIEWVQVLKPGDTIVLYAIGVKR